MRVIIDSFNECFQNDTGGIRVKILSYLKYMDGIQEIKLFNKWSDKIENYDILHVFKPGIQNYREILFAKRKGLKIVLSSVAEEESNMSILAKKMVFMTPLRIPYYYIRKDYEMADCIIAETIYEKRYLEKAFNIQSDKIVVLPNGIDIDYKKDYGTLFPDKYGIQKPYILQVGRFDENKNQLSTIKAVSQTDLRLVLIGGPDKDNPEYYKKCKEMAGSNVTFVGWINHEDPLLVSAFQNCQTFVLPSQKEILGNALLEAGACGANLVVTKALPIHDWGISEYVYQIDPMNVEDIREKLIESSRCEPRKELSERIRSTFDWEKIAREHMMIYRKVLDA